MKLKCKFKNSLTIENGFILKRNYSTLHCYIKYKINNKVNFIDTVLKFIYCIIGKRN